MLEFGKWIGITKTKETDLSDPLNLLDEKVINGLVSESRTPIFQGVLTISKGDEKVKKNKYIIPPAGYSGATISQEMDVIFFSKLGIKKPAIEVYLSADQAESVEILVNKVKNK